MDVDALEEDDERTEELPRVPSRHRWLGPTSAATAFVAATGVFLAVLIPLDDSAPTLAAATPTTSAPPVLTAASPTSVTTTSSTTTTPPTSPCSSPRAFSEAVARADAAYTARNHFDGYTIKGCGNGVALAWGLEGEQDATWVALFRAGDGYELDDWATGAPCPPGRTLPADLAEQACADFVPTSTSTTEGAAPTTASVAPTTTR